MWGIFKSSNKRYSNEKIIELITSGKEDEVIIYIYRNLKKTAEKRFGKSSMLDAKDFEDIFQESIINFWKKVKKPNFFFNNKWESYYFTIHKNQSVDYHKKKINRYNRDKRFLDRNPEVNLYKTLEKSPEDILSKKEIMEEIKAALEFLPELQKNVFIQREIEGMKHKEIAEFLNIKEVESRKQLLKARKKLCSILQNLKNDN